MAFSTIVYLQLWVLSRSSDRVEVTAPLNVHATDNFVLFVQKCAEGQVCKMQQVQCIRAPCFDVPTCLDIGTYARIRV